jgi:hypothetical protein
VESTLTTNGYMWKRYSGFCGSRLNLETIKETPLGHYRYVECEERLRNR